MVIIGIICLLLSLGFLLSLFKPAFIADKKTGEVPTRRKIFSYFMITLIFGSGFLSAADQDNKDQTKQVANDSSSQQQSQKDITQEIIDQQARRYKGDEYPKEDLINYQANISSIQSIDDKLTAAYKKYQSSMAKAMKASDLYGFMGATQDFNVRCIELLQDADNLKFIELKNPTANKAVSDTSSAIKDSLNNWERLSSVSIGMLNHEISDDKAQELMQAYKFKSNKDAGEEFIAIKNGYESYGYDINAISSLSSLRSNAKKTILINGKEDDSVFASVDLDLDEKLSLFTNDLTCEKDGCLKESDLDRYISSSDEKIKKAKYTPSEDAKGDGTTKQEKMDYHVALFISKNIKPKTDGSLFDLILKCNKSFKSTDVSGVIMNGENGEQNLTLTYIIHPINSEGKKAKEELTYELVGNKLKATSVYLSSDILTSATAMADYGYKCM